MARREHCTWDADAGWITPASEGARPCPRAHCGMRGRCANHVNTEVGHITCPSCIGRVRKQLRRIEVLYSLDLEAEVTEDGVDSEAMSLLGVAAVPGAVDNRRGVCDYPKRVELHPYTVLAGWDLALREEYGPPTELAITVPRAVDYLTKLLAGAFPHGDQFEEFAREIAKCHAHLEEVVHLAMRPEEGAPCPECAEPSPRLRKRYADHDKTGASDTWHCPHVPEHWWTDRDYRLRLQADYLDHADALTVDQLADRYSVPASTIRRWAATTNTHRGGEWVTLPPKLKTAGRDAQGRKLYRASELETLLGQESA